MGIAPTQASWAAFTIPLSAFRFQQTVHLFMGYGTWLAMGYVKSVRSRENEILVPDVLPVAKARRFSRSELLLWNELGSFTAK